MILNAHVSSQSGSWCGRDRPNTHGLYSVTGAVPGTPDKAEDMRHPTESHPAGPRVHLKERGKSELSPRHRFTESLLPTTARRVPIWPRLKGKAASWVSQLDRIRARVRESAGLRPQLSKEEQSRDKGHSVKDPGDWESCLPLSPALTRGQ